MAGSQASRIIRHVRGAALQDAAGLTDGQLLARFIEQGDAAAFAAIVHRHGRMVWGVCRRLVGHHDAEDAFQAAFLVLARKAASIRPREMAANWLYGVARQAALQARRALARRRARERQVTEMPEPEASPRDPCADLQSLLDLELGGLSDKYRVVIVLCDLEGKSRKEAARQLGCPEGTVAGRLARGRAMLARRMQRHGLASSGGALAAVLSEQAASTSVPSSVVSSTIKAVNLLAAGQAATGAISVKVVALTEGVLKAMMLTKLTTATAVLFVIAALIVGTGLTYRAQAQQTPAAQSQSEPKDNDQPMDKNQDGLKRQQAAQVDPKQPAAPVQDDTPPHIVEKPDMKGRMESGLPSGATEDGAVVVKSFFAKMPTYPDIRFREFFDPRYLKKHGLTDRDIAFEIADHQGIDSLLVADDNLTVLVVLEVKGGGKEAFVMRCVVYEGHIYISPEKAPDPKTGIFTPWILRTKLIERKQSPLPVPSDKTHDKTPHVVEKADKKGSDPRLWKVGGEPTEEQLLVVSKNFMSLISYPHDQNDEFRFQEFFDPRYLKKHGLTDHDIAFELAYSQRIVILDVADDLRTVLCGIELKGGKKEAIILRWVVYEGHLYITPEKAPDPETGIFTPWILRTKVN